MCVGTENLNPEYAAVAGRQLSRERYYFPEGWTRIKHLRVKFQVYPEDRTVSSGGTDGK